ncbi:MAG: hypothetical protein ABEK75_09235 [Salinibacter sp.]
MSGLDAVRLNFSAQNLLLLNVALGVIMFGVALNLMTEKLFGGLSMACDFANLVQNGFCTRPVAPLQGSFGPRSCTSLAVSRLNIHPPNSF